MHILCCVYFKLCYTVLLLNPESNEGSVPFSIIVIAYWYINFNISLSSTSLGTVVVFENILNNQSKHQYYLW